MLIEQITGTACVEFVERPLGLGAAEPCAIGGGFPLRLVSCCALFELFQIDQIPHAGLLHAASVVIATMKSIDERMRIQFELAESKFG
jgi:hypothetical protein